MSKEDIKKNLHIVPKQKLSAIFAGRKYMILIAITFVLVALDQFTKILVHSSFELSQSIVIIENFFNLTYVRNQGAAFGFLGQMPSPYREMIFLTLPPLAIVFILVLLHSTPEREKLQIYALAMVCGGALGNYLDRLRFGYVIDFLDFHWYEKYTWPAFNVADMAIVTGVGITALFIFKGEPAADENKSPSTDGTANAPQEK